MNERGIFNEDLDIPTKNIQLRGGLLSDRSPIAAGSGGSNIEVVIMKLMHKLQNFQYVAIGTY